MNKQNILKRDPAHNRSVVMTIRISPHQSKWIAERKYSPTAIFHEALKDLGYEFPEKK